MPGPEIALFKCKYGLKATFYTTPQNLKRQMPSYNRNFSEKSFLANLMEKESIFREMILVMSQG